MSHSVSISIDICKSHFPEFYIDLVRRMRGPVEDPEVYMFRVPRFPTQRQVSVDIDDPQFEDLVHATWESDTGLDITMGYRLFSGDEGQLDLHFLGKHYYPESLAETGHCRVVFPFNDLVHVFEEDVDQKTFRRAQDIIDIEDNLTTQNTEQLFFHACGLLEKEAKTSVIHCAEMSLNFGWSSTPGECSMLYHRRPEGFSRDFLRIYADYQWGARMTSMDTEDADIWRLKDAPCPVADTIPGKENRYADQWYEMEEGRLTHAFLENLTEQQVRKLSEIQSTEMHCLLLDACQKLGWPVCHDFGDRGIVLSTGPMSHLWLVYVTVAEMVESGTGV